MKSIEAMKRLRVIEKRIGGNSSSITLYSSSVSTEKPLYETESNQRAEVASLIQSNKDLLTEYLGLKRKIEETNLRTIVEIGGIEYAISDLLIIKRKMANLMVRTYRALNEEQGDKRKISAGMGQDGQSV
ncbi:hypothetical protein LCGC14_1913140 [marine sediment metagenome]|uniref:Uncharacterized protein n=1 Tax=marine sediment metagenome TaxID=412755 RepID=A0A0F9I721_9ZZZZ